MARISPAIYVVAAHAHRALSWARSKAWQASMILRGEPASSFALSVSSRTTVGDVVRRRPPHRQTTYSLPCTASAHDALRLMVDASVTAVVVLDSVTQQAVGIVTQSDFLQRVAYDERSPRRVLLSDIMTPLHTAAFVFPDNTIGSCMETMAAARCHHLAVMSDTPPHGQLLAVVGMPELLGLTRALRDHNAARKLMSELERPPRHVTV